MIDKMVDEEFLRYKKKKSQKSKSSKRSDHKHQYEDIIVKSLVGWQWAERCIICNRVKYKIAISDREFVRPECRQLPYVSQQTYYTYEELLKLYPNVDIINEFVWNL